MKNQLLLALALSAAVTFNASAAQIYDFKGVYQSGATVIGTLGYDPSANLLTDIDLVYNGSLGVNVALTWSWFNGTGNDFRTANGSGTFFDWVLNGSNSGYSIYDGLSFLVDANGITGIDVGHIGNNSTDNTINYSDPILITASSVNLHNTVPEPASIALIGLGFAGMRYMRRRQPQT